MRSLGLSTSDLRIVFNAFDRDHDGSIEYNELVHVVRNPDVISKKISKLSHRTRYVGNSHSLKARLKEEKRRLKLIQNLPKRMRHHFNQNVRQLGESFKKFDGNRDGVINKHQFLASLRMIRITPSKNEIKQMIKLLDTDRNGKIKYKDLMLALKDSRKRRTQTGNANKKLSPQPPRRAGTQFR